ncbi:MAG TPA: T9SS type A sorting domain-containing protein, partial [Bacteroidia bacterium]|nr:T9SS type A sorting domain-containing protein [Bacteroidia bacterium]
DNDGSATVTAGGGTSPYTYKWGSNCGSQTTATATALSAGTYTVTVTDAAGCTKTATVTITQPATAVTAFFCGVTGVTCHGGNNGSAQGMASGGTSPYSYHWSNGETKVTPTNFSAGTYTVTVTDHNGCTATAAVTITQPTAITVTTTQTNVSVHNGTNGTATATAGGGTPGYTYHWSCSQTNARATGLSAGTYTVTVTDSHGCTGTASVTITQPPAHASVFHNDDNDSTKTVTDVVLYPNPTFGEFHIKGVEQGDIIQIYDYAGRLVRTGNADKSDMIYNLTDQPNGIYLIRIISTDGTLISQKKLIKQW